MRIMVFDVPAESGGALTVLQEYYKDACKDIENEYLFVVSKPTLQERVNVKIIKFPWVKKSWLHRLFFDYIIAPKLVKKRKADKVLSLQNILIPRVKVRQSLLVHNALPFSCYKVPLHFDKLLWVYQNILDKMMKRSIQRADEVIVQNQWMKNYFVKILQQKEDKITVRPTKPLITVKDSFEETKAALSTFFYPAGPAPYKNHKVILDACLRLKREGYRDFKVLFTIKGNENKYAAKLLQLAKDKKLPIEFVGPLARHKVYDYYSKSVLIFPSHIETVGLPLVEAAQHNTPILCADYSYAHEMLGNYQNVYYFNALSADELKNAMELLLMQGTR